MINFQHKDLKNSPAYRPNKKTVSPSVRQKNDARSVLLQPLLINLLEKDELEEIIHYLKEEEFLHSFPNQLEIDTLQFRLAFLAQKLTQADIEKEEARIERSRIRLQLRDCIQRIPENTCLTSTQKRYHNKRRIASVLQMGIYVIAGIMIYLLVTYRVENIRIKGDMLLDQLSFTHVSGAYHWEEQVVEHQSLSLFESITIEGDKIAWDKRMRRVFSYPTTLHEALVFSPTEGNKPMPLQLQGELQLDHLPISPRTHLTIEKPFRLENLNMFRLILEKDSILDGSFSYRDELYITAEQVEVEGVNALKAISTPTYIKVLGSENLRKPIHFTSHSGSFVVDIAMKDSLHVPEKTVQIENLSFFRKENHLDNAQLISTILSGEVQIIEEGKEAWKTIPLAEGDGLTLTPANTAHQAPAFHVERFTITKEGIALSFTGYVSHMEFSTEVSDFKPTLLDWLMHNYRFQMIASTILLFGLIIVFPEWLKQLVMGKLRTV